MHARIVLLAGVIGVAALSRGAFSPSAAARPAAARAPTAPASADVAGRAAAVERSAIDATPISVVARRPWHLDSPRGCDPGCVDILARVLFAEADKENDGVMTAIGWVVVNRVRDDRREFRRLASCRDVVLQPHAFSCVGGSRWRLAADPRELKGLDGKNHERARSIAAGILAGDIPDTTGGALLYYSPQSMIPRGAVPKGWDFDRLEEVRIEGVTGEALRLFRYR